MQPSCTDNGSGTQPGPGAVPTIRSLPARRHADATRATQLALLAWPRAGTAQLDGKPSPGLEPFQSISLVCVLLRACSHIVSRENALLLQRFRAPVPGPLPACCKQTNKHRDGTQGVEETLGGGRKVRHQRKAQDSSVGWCRFHLSALSAWFDLAEQLRRADGASGTDCGTLGQPSLPNVLI